MRRTAMQAIGIVTLLVGVSNFLEHDNPLVPLVGVILGVLVGELCRIEDGLKRFGDALEKRFSSGESPVSRPFVTTSRNCLDNVTFRSGVVAGVGLALAPAPARAGAVDEVLDDQGRGAVGGSLEDGLRGNYDLLALKISLDFIAALGMLLVVQGSLTLGARFVEPVVTDPMISAATATGGVLIFGLGLMLLELKEVRVANMLPALLFAPLLVAAAPLWPF
jgi:uncharacterized membrane protein YqgA involved in biofilm formation